jgi:hypothetical protein
MLLLLHAEDRVTVRNDRRFWPTHDTRHTHTFYFLQDSPRHCSQLNLLHIPTDEALCNKQMMSSTEEALAGPFCGNVTVSLIPVARSRQRC